MENVTKGLLIAGAVLITIVLITTAIIIVKSGNGYEEVTQMGTQISTVSGTKTEQIISDLDKENKKNSEEKEETKIPIQQIIPPSSREDIYINDKFQIQCSIYPNNATNKNLTWTSSNPSVATVDKNGLVTGISLGQTKITIKSNDGGNAETNLWIVVNYCFTEGTKVLTENGLINIENITIGVKVYSMNMTKKEIELKSVKDTFKNDVFTDMCKIYIGEQYIESTVGHNYYEKTKGWTKAQNLQAGDILLTSDGEEKNISKVETIKKKSIVYNLSIEDNHNYFVSEEKVLVHNACAPTTDF